MENMGQNHAERFIVSHGVNIRADQLMTFLAIAGVYSEQDWEQEKTEWVFRDGSRIVICGSEIGIVQN